MKGRITEKGGVGSILRICFACQVTAVARAWNLELHLGFSRVWHGPKLWAV